MLRTYLLWTNTNYLFIQFTTVLIIEGLRQIAINHCKKNSKESLKNYGFFGTFRQLFR